MSGFGQIDIDLTMPSPLSRATTGVALPNAVVRERVAPSIRDRIPISFC